MFWYMHPLKEGKLLYDRVEPDQDQIKVRSELFLVYNHCMYATHIKW
jgi:hypothetical protein